MTTRRHVGTIPGVPTRRCVSPEGPESTHGRRKRLADMASAFEDRAVGQDRPQWAQGRRALSWPGAEWRLSVQNGNKRTAARHARLTYRRVLRGEAFDTWRMATAA